MTCKTLIVTLLLVAAIAGCRSRPRDDAKLPPPTTRPLEVLKKPAIDLTRGGAGFPLDVETPPADIDELTRALRQAYAARLENDPRIRIATEGDSLDDLRSLAIDLTGSSVRGTIITREPPGQTEVTPYLNVAKLSYVADPLKYQNYSASMVLEATDARLGLATGPDKKLSLTLYDCREGHARLRIDLRDLERGLAASTRLRGLPGIRIEQAQLQMRSASPRNLEARITMRASFLLIPATFRLVGRADVDEQFNIHFTSLAASGDDPGGVLIAGFIQTRLDKLNDKAAPLLKLPGDKIHVSDLMLTLDRDLTIDIKLTGSQR